MTLLDFEGLVLVDDGDYSLQQVNETVIRSTLYDGINVIRVTSFYF